MHQNNHVVSKNESVNGTEKRRTMDNSQAFRAIGLDVRTLGLDPKTHYLPRVLDSGIVIIARWRGKKADVSLYKDLEGKLRVKATYKQSGKSYSAPLSSVDVPAWRTVADVLKWSSEHGYLRLRQPREDALDESQVEDQRQAERSALLLPDAA